MNLSIRSLMTTLAAALVVSALLVACASDKARLIGPLESVFDQSAANDKVFVCHKPGEESTILDVDASALQAHLDHGDYVTTEIVSHDASQPTDGVHFSRITDALSAARAVRLAHGELLSAACRITIAVSGEQYIGTTSGGAAGDLENFPMIVDVPDITLQGAMIMALDGDGRATGDPQPGSSPTTLTPAEPLPVVAAVSTPIIVANGHPGGSAANGLTVQGFVFQSGHDPAIDAGGQGILAVRVTGLTILGNRFEPGFTESMDLRASSASVLQNHLSGTAGTCDICLAAPGTYLASGNRLLAGGIPGITMDGAVGLPVPVGVEPFILPATTEMWAEISNNEVQDHQRTPVGVGIRVDALGTGGPNVHNTLHANIHDNLLVNNRFGMIIHAAFPVANTDRKSDLDVTLHGNLIQQSCQARLLVSFSRHTTALGLTSNPYLLNSTFNLSLGGDVDWNDVWYSHPAGFGNTLIVDGQTIDNGSRQFYSAASCPGD